MNYAEMREELISIGSQIGAQVAEREEVIEVLLMCLLSGTHPLLIGPPGAAKSLLVSLLASAFGENNVFSISGAPTVQETDIFGPVSLSALKNDEYRRVVKNFLPGRPFAILDEVPRFSSQIMDSLFAVMNEGVYKSNGELVDADTLLIMGTANDVSSVQKNQAFWDRWLVRIEVGYIKDGSNWMSMMQAGPLQPIKTKLTLQDLLELRGIVSQIPSSREIVERQFELKVKLEAVGIKLSDRRWKSANKLLQASAFLHGDETLQIHHFPGVYRHTHWETSSQQADLVTILNQYRSPFEQAKQAIQADLDALLALDASNWREVMNRGKSLEERIQQEIAKLDSQRNRNLSGQAKAFRAFLEESRVTAVSHVQSISSF